MEKEFWFNKWEKNEIGFHQSEVNPLLVNNIHYLSLKEGNRIFIPLCGKTLDIKWLLDQNFKVVGCELVESAIEQLFQELQIKPQISVLDNIKHYFTDNLDIFVGNIFDLNKNLLGNIDAIYDRASLVALPFDTRKKYTSHLIDITNNTPQILIVFEYDQDKVEGPPFSISIEEINKHYENFYRINLAEKKELDNGLKGNIFAIENVWYLQKIIKD